MGANPPFTIRPHSWLLLATTVRTQLPPSPPPSMHSLMCGEPVIVDSVPTHQSGRATWHYGQARKFSGAAKVGGRGETELQRNATSHRPGRAPHSSSTDQRWPKRLRIRCTHSRPAKRACWYVLTGGLMHSSRAQRGHVGFHLSSSPQLPQRCGRRWPLCSGTSPSTDAIAST